MVSLKEKIKALSPNEQELLFLRMKQMLAKQETSKTKDIQRVVAYLKVNDLYNRNKLNSFLKAKIPDYMIPSAMVELDSFPLLPNGKVDLNKLRKAKRTESKSASQKVFKSPSNEIETKLVEIWQNVLGIDAISVQDNFFDIGGDSILSIQIIANARKLGVNLTPNQLFENQTIEELSRLISDKDATKPNSKALSEEFKHVVSVKSEGSKPPLFCIHGGGAHFFFYNLLGSVINKDRPVYAVQASGLDGELILHKSVQDTAIDFLNEIKQVQKEGPYHIMAYCFSTAVGLEISQILKRDGEKVNLIIVDTVAKNQDRFAADRTQHRAKEFFQRLSKNPFRALYILVKSRINRFIKPVIQTLVGSENQRKIAILRNHQVKTYLDYKWNTYNNTINVLITEKDDSTLNRDIKNTWNEISADKVILTYTEGHHDTLFKEPIVKHTAKTLENCMLSFENQ